MQEEAKPPLISVLLEDPILDQFNVLIHIEYVREVEYHGYNVCHSLIISLPQIPDEVLFMAACLFKLDPRDPSIILGELDPNFPQLG